MKKSHLMGVVCACLFSLFLSTNANASITRLDFEIAGHVTSIDTALVTEFTGGENVVFTFNLLAEDQTPGFRNLARDLSLSFGSDYFISSSTVLGEVDVYNGIFSTGSSPDSFNFEKNNMNANDVNGYSLNDTFIRFGVGDLFIGPDNYIEDFAELSMLDGATIFDQGGSALLFSNGGSDVLVEFDVDSISVQATSAVPVPPAVYLFGSGLLGLIGIARRKKPA